MSKDKFVKKASREPIQTKKVSRVSLYREALNLSKKDVYEAVGVSDTCYRAWESGKFLPTGQNLYKLAKVLKVSPEVLAGKEVFPGATLEDLKSFYESKDKKFSKALKFLREERKFSQGYMSEALRVPRTTYSNWERGICYPPLESFKTIVRLLKVQGQSKCLPSQESFQIIFKKLSEGE